MKKIIMTFSLLLLVSCGERYKITGKNFYKAGGEKYLECIGGESYKTCKEKTGRITTRYAVAFDNGMWINISKEEYEKYNIGDTYETRVFQIIKK